MVDYRIVMGRSCATASNELTSVPQPKKNNKSKKNISYMFYVDTQVQQLLIFTIL